MTYWQERRLKRLESIALTVIIALPLVALYVVLASGAVE